MDESLVKLLIFVLLIGGLWVLRALFGGEKPAGQPQRPPQPRPMPPPPDPRRQAQQQVTEFLEQAQAAQRGATGYEERQTKRKQGGKQQQGGKPQRGGKPASPPVPAALGSRTPLTGESDPYGESVAEHVSRHLNTREFDERAKTLSQVSAEQQKLSQHVHEVFDHALGTLAGRTIKGTEGAASAAAPTVEEEPSYAADQLLAWLRDPASLRQAIVLHEVLERPAARW